MDGTENISDFMVNGNHFIFYQMPEYDTMSLATYTKDSILEFTFSPVETSDFGDYAEIMGASISKTK